MKIIDIASLRNERSQIADTARAWVVRLDGDDLSMEELDELKAWLQASSAHRRAFQQTLAVWGCLDRLSELSLDPVDVAVATYSPSWRFGAAFALLVCSFIGFAWQHFAKEPGSQVSVEYGTAIGEVKSVALPDGSNVRLNTKTSVSVNYEQEARFVRMAEGEAYFEVAHDPQKPFLVYVGKQVVRAVGTAFSISANDNSIDVIVTDGRVEVSSYDDQIAKTEKFDIDLMEKAKSRVPLDKGQHGIFNEAAGQLELVQKLMPEAIERDLSWRDGILIFDDDPLDQVIKEIGRYTPMRIIISDPEIRDMRFGGYFKIGEVTAVLDTIQSDFGIQVDKIDEELVYLSLKK
ncbi:MAG: FecR family protein [Azoarcus sp.]|nr:FecR family protein [Azoarcus sp.]